MTTGIVVAGGTSRRFGPGDKALAPVAGSPMIRHVVGALEPITDAVVVNCREGQRPAFETALSTGEGVRFAIDRVPDSGPVAGLETACAVVDDDVAIVVGCDVPLVTTATLSSVLARLEARPVDVVVPRVDGRRQPLCGTYRVDALEDAIDAVGDAQGCRVGALFDHLDVHAVSARRLPGGDRAFWNVNTRSDLAFARRWLRASRPGRLEDGPRPE
ncbi:molybdenum cofactor guanylyltransferase [Natronobeatus ordinarius]|uniref:molybdenum cofactor guanylyltransferase n=1 Tax=Natronobeatus ordinarius TaxID=2963433 RepID=UPI0020CE7A28|nr:molybdenum cofactor guanylyltransferase [Natronobeatus ordinarius]